ncbi:MAG TPA: PKD domain-containing protein, partial [Candidatus Binatia bacterium]|nr:PKD domain-containing protein [Candidatus Binatia bacterium]
RVIIRAARVGSYRVVVGAADASGEITDTFLVTIEDHAIHHAPRFESISNLTVDQGARASETLVATDADGDDLRIELVRGPRYVGLGSPRYTPGRAERDIGATPGGMDVSGTALVRCTDGLIETQDSLQVVVNDVNFAPRFEWRPSSESCAAQGENGWVDLPFFDADGDSMALSTEGLPPWARAECFTFPRIPLGYVSLYLQPQRADSLGRYPVRVRILDPAGRSAEASVTIVLEPPGSCGGNEPPVCPICASSPLPPTAVVGGPYKGVAGVPISFDGRQSHSDGAIQYRWDFGDGAKASGPNPTHVYSSGGDFRVLLSVWNPGGVSSDSALVRVAAGYPVRAFLSPAGRPLVSVAGNERFPVFVESPESTYTAQEIDPASIVVGRSETFPGAGVVNGRDARLGDSDKNGVPDLEVALSGDALRSLVASASGRSELDLNVEGRLTGGGHLVGSLRLTALGTPAKSGRAVVGPNPMNPAGTFYFDVPRSGPVSVRIYEVGGRLVRTLVDATVPAGPMTVSFNGRDGKGRELATGIYFYRIETTGGRQVGRISLLK